jgi:hypothetical protein
MPRRDPRLLPVHGEMHPGWLAPGPLRLTRLGYAKAHVRLAQADAVWHGEHVARSGAP